MSNEALKWFDCYDGPGPARVIPVTALIYRQVLQSTGHEAAQKPGLSGMTNITLASYPSLQAAALNLPAGVDLEPGNG